MEIWRPVVGLEGQYEVSNFGNVRSLDRKAKFIWKGKEYVRNFKGKILCLRTQRRGHLYVNLTRQYTKQVHRLVMAAFVGPCPKNLEVCHNNGIPSDNRLENLRYDTRSANAQDAIRHRVYPLEARSLAARKGWETRRNG